MADVVLGRCAFGPDVPRISRFRSPVEVFRRREDLRVGVAALGLEVVREPLLHLDVAAMVGRSARVLVLTVGQEPRIGPGAQEEETGVGRIRIDRREVLVGFAELSKPEYAGIARGDDEVAAKLPADTQAEVARLRVAQVRSDRTHATEES